MYCHSVLARLPCSFVWGRGCADGESGVRWIAQFRSLGPPWRAPPALCSAAGAVPRVQVLPYF